MIASLKPNGIYRLCEWEEVVGVLNELDESQGVLFAKISNISIVLPIEMAEILKIHRNKRLAILRTDDQNQPYRWRLLD